MELSPRDERPHPSGAQRWWAESWYFDWATLDGTFGGYARLGLHPNLGVSWYWACAVGPDRPLTIVVDHEVELPRPGSLEIRAEGLWADHTIETPFDHVTLGCEAFAVGVDDPSEVYVGELRGDVVPLGLDLEWETVGPGPHPRPGSDGYEVPCRVHGEVLLGDERVELDGIGQRDHAWGVPGWWTRSWTRSSGGLEDGTRFHLDDVSGYVMELDGPIEPIAEGSSSVVLGREGLPEEATIACGPLHLAVTPVAFAPVLVGDGDPSSGRSSRLARALCRFEAVDGRGGVGWTEWNQPQG